MQGLFSGKFNVYHAYEDEKGAPKIKTTSVSHQGVLTPALLGDGDVLDDGFAPAVGWGYFLLMESWKSDGDKPVVYPLKKSHAVEINTERELEAPAP